MKWGGSWILPLWLALATPPASAALRTPATVAEQQPLDAAMSDAKAVAPAPHPHPAPTPLPASDGTAELRRAWGQQVNELTGRIDQLEGRLYEVVGRLQMLTGALIVLLTGILIGMIEMWRRSSRQ